MAAADSLLARAGEAIAAADWKRAETTLRRLLRSRDASGPGGLQSGRWCLWNWARATSPAPGSPRRSSGIRTMDPHGSNLGRWLLDRDRLADARGRPSRRSCGWSRTRPMPGAISAASANGWRPSRIPWRRGRRWRGWPADRIPRPSLERCGRCWNCAGPRRWNCGIAPGGRTPAIATGPSQGPDTDQRTGTLPLDPVRLAMTGKGPPAD